MAKPGFSLNRDDYVRLTKAMDRLAEFPEEAKKETRHIGEQTVGRAKKNATNMGAVDTGRLRRGIEWRPSSNGTGVTIESSAIDPQTGRDYAATVHEGLGRGKNSTPRRNLAQAFEWATRTYEKRLRNLIIALWRR